MKILFRTYVSLEECLTNCDCAVVELTPSLVQQIGHRVEFARRLLAEDQELYRVYFWDDAVEFYDYELVVDGKRAVGDALEWHETLDRRGHVLLPAGIDLDNHQPQRVECRTMRIECVPAESGTQWYIAWAAMPKHMDVEIFTQSLWLPDFERYAAGDESANTDGAPDD